MRTLPNKRLVTLGATLAIPVVLTGFGCIGSSGNGATDDASSSARRRFPLETLPTTTVGIGAHTLRVWLVDTPDEREEGLMWVPEAEIADDQGMLFVFQFEQYLGFWMKNTITPLDIAYARLDGTIVTIHTMPPLTLQSFPSFEPALFALEVKAGTFERLGVKEGDRLIIPPDVFKVAP